MPLFRGTRYPILTAGAKARLFYDSFTGADGMLLTAHTPEIDRVGGGWVNDNGAAQLLSNQAKATTSGRIYCETGENDVALALDGMIVSTDNNDAISLGLLARFQDGTHCWVGYFSLDSDSIRLFERNGGQTLRASAAKTFNANTEYPLSLTVNGTNLTLASGVTSVSYISTAMQTQTKHGIVVETPTGAKYTLFNNFQVEAV